MLHYFHPIFTLLLKFMHNNTILASENTTEEYEVSKKNIVEEREEVGEGGGANEPMVEERKRTTEKINKPIPHFFSYRNKGQTFPIHRLPAPQPFVSSFQISS